MTSGNSTYYFHPGMLGSVANLTDASGVSQWAYSYEPFGTTRTETKEKNNAPSNFMKFAGEYRDPTGLLYLRARYYEPVTGRFQARDPLCRPPGTPSISKYSYADVRPTVLIDPSGMSSEGPTACGVVTGSRFEGISIGVAAAAGDFVSGVNGAAERLDEGLAPHIRGIPRVGETLARRALPVVALATAAVEACANRTQGQDWGSAITESAVANGGAAVGATLAPGACLALAPTGWGAVACAGGMAIIGGVGGHEIGERLWDWLS